MQFAIVKKASRLNSYLVMFISFVAGVFFLVSGFLYRENSIYKKENRKLIIQNDSIISVNIELKNALHKNASSLRKTALVRNKE